MARGVEPFTEEAYYLTALYKEYSKRSDMDAIAAVEQELNEIGKKCSTTEADVRHIIRGGFQRLFSIVTLWMSGSSS